MENLVICLNAVLPLLCIMLLGYCARRMGMLGDSEVIRMNSIGFFFFVPCLLFDSVYSADLSGAADIKLMIFAAATVALPFFAAHFIIVRKVEGKKKQSVAIMGIFRSNCALVGMHMVKSLMPGADISVAAILITVVAIVNNFFGVICMSIFSEQKNSARDVVLNIIKNPLLISCFAGIIFAYFGWRLPTFAESLVSDIADMSSPLLLFLLGAFFKFEGVGKFGRELVMICVGRLIVVPAVFLPLAWWLGFRGVGFAALLGCLAAPVASTSFTMAQQMGADAELAGDAVVLSSLLCPLTIFVWCVLAKNLGLM